MKFDQFKLILSEVIFQACLPFFIHFQRSKFVTAYMGSSIGVAIAYPIFGYIIKTSCWENVFHFCGILGTIWYCLWLYFIYDLPEDHPRIHPKEKEFILKALGSSVMRGDKSNLKVPWKAILSSRATWMNIVAQWGGVWGLFTLITQAPSYFRLVHGWGIEMTGILSGMPHLVRVIFSLLMSFLCDYLLTTNKMSRTNVRKFAAFFSKPNICGDSFFFCCWSQFYLNLQV